jgi:prophage regulatory protein
MSDVNSSRPRLLRLPAVMERTGYKRTKIYELIERGEFPRQISIGARAVAWIESEIDGWIETQIKNARHRSVA